VHSAPWSQGPARKSKRWQEDYFEVKISSLAWPQKTHLDQERKITHKRLFEDGQRHPSTITRVLQLVKQHHGYTSVNGEKFKPRRSLSLLLYCQPVIHWNASVVHFTLIYSSKISRRCSSVHFLHSNLKPEIRENEPVELRVLASSPLSLIYLIPKNCHCNGRCEPLTKIFTNNTSSWYKW